jgi:tetratricopeptide (TPR) repeat protein
MRTFGFCSALTLVRKLTLIIAFSAVITMLFCCERAGRKSAETVAPADSYLNHSDSAHYVGMTACRSCHEAVYQTFIRTGMGQSIAAATRTKSSAAFDRPPVYDKFSDLYYKPSWRGNEMYMTEYRLSGGETLHKRSEKVDYIIGSGQHTNSHITSVNRYLYQMPLTYYTQKKKWDLPPGFENGHNTRFSRKIGMECMSCHSALPEHVQGSENKFSSVPEGINCERCHGPGSVHVNQRRTSAPVDTSRYTDYSIVNPARLSVERQIDVCQRCHLQGNMVLKEGKSFADFRPGMKLSDFISVFIPRYTGADDAFIMASHADRLKQSACFIRSAARTTPDSSLKPYKNALTCITCHNPHVSVRETGTELFNKACLNCHMPGSAATLSITAAHAGIKVWNDCVKCHMPTSGSTDIPHVSVHDHYIRKPVSKQYKKDLKEFTGLFSLNDRSPSVAVRAEAYLHQYEKFEQDPQYLDSALALINRLEVQNRTGLLIRYYYIRHDFDQVIKLISAVGESACMKQFSKAAPDNRYAWTCYYAGESVLNMGDHQGALRWFSQAVRLAPYSPDFRNKLGTVYVLTGNKEAGRKEFEYLLHENPEFISTYSNLGYLALAEGFPAEAIRLYNQGLKLDPDNIQLLLNTAGYYIYTGQKGVAADFVKRALKKEPGNAKAKAILEQLKNMP